MILNKELPAPNATGIPEVCQIDIFELSEDMKGIHCNCIDTDKNILAVCWLCYIGEDKNVPFTLTKAEIDKIKASE